MSDPKKAPSAPEGAIPDQSDWTTYLAAAMEHAPNAERLDTYESDMMVATLDRKKRLLAIAPKPESAIAWDVRTVELTEEVDAMLAFCESVGHLNFRKADESWFYPSNYLWRLYWAAPQRVRLTEAQAAHKIFLAKSHFESLEHGTRTYSMHDGSHIEAALVRQALKGREAVGVSSAKDEHKGETIILDVAHPPYVRPGDAVEYWLYSPQHDPRPMMMALCATLPENMDPKGAKVEPLYVDKNLFEPGLIEGLEYSDRLGRVIPPERRRLIGMAVAYTPKGQTTTDQFHGNGIAFHTRCSAENRTSYAPWMPWRKDAGVFHLVHSYDRCDLADLEFFVRVAIGYTSPSRHEYPAGHSPKVGMRFYSLPLWMPHCHTMDFRVTKDRPEIGQPFFAAWTTESRSPEYPFDHIGLAVLLADGKTALCGDSLRLPIEEVRVVGHALNIGFEARTEEVPTIGIAEVEGLPELLAREKVAA